MNTFWPQWLINSFESANQLATDESAYYGPYTRLLYHLFGVEGPFEISPRYYIPGTNESCELNSVVALFIVELDKHPVFFIEIKALASFALDSKRKQADEQMRGHFRDLYEDVATPRLPGISAFGARMSFYEYVVATNTLTPHPIPPDPVSLNDTAPAERWSYDLLEANGTAQMRGRRCQGDVSGPEQLKSTSSMLSCPTTPSYRNDSSVGKLGGMLYRARDVILIIM